MISGLPTKLALTSGEVRAALAPTLTTTVNGVKETLDRTPPELASDISAHGIVLAGGGRGGNPAPAPAPPSAGPSSACGTPAWPARPASDRRSAGRSRLARLGRE